MIVVQRILRGTTLRNRNDVPRRRRMTVLLLAEVQQAQQTNGQRVLLSCRCTASRRNHHHDRRSRFMIPSAAQQQQLSGKTLATAQLTPSANNPLVASWGRGRVPNGHAGFVPFSTGADAAAAKQDSSPRGQRQHQQPYNDMNNTTGKQQRQRLMSSSSAAIKRGGGRARKKRWSDKTTARRLWKHRRNKALRPIRTWLAEDSNYRELTLRSFRMSLAAGVGTTNDDNNKDYRDFYLDSIGSFMERLRRKIDHDNNQDVEEDDERLFSALDSLVHAGFGNRKWANRHRGQEDAAVKHAQSRARIDHQRRIVQTRHHDVVAAKVELNALEERLARRRRSRHHDNQHHQQQHPAHDDDDDDDDADAEASSSSLPPSSPSVRPQATSTTSFLRRAMDGIKQHFLAQNKEDAVEIKGQQEQEKAPPSSSPETWDEEGEQEQERLLLEDKIRQRKAYLETTLRKKLFEAQFELGALSRAHDKLVPPLTQQEYDSGTEAARRAMEGTICPMFAEHLLERDFQLARQHRNLDAKTDLTKPHEWFLYARLDRRKIIYHGGPTNSGKTYEALQRLKTAERGMYLAPLRLLAAEVYETLTADGVYCNLYTGQEKREIPFATHGAATMEMANLDRDYDIVVIDEIQMIAQPDRGFAWTRALLGTRCKEIHVCGGLEAAGIIERIARSCGDDFELHRYERFSELMVADASLANTSDQVGSYGGVRTGDCVVAFSRNDIFAIKREIERNTHHKCCVVYGSLPPKTRSEQARRFNDPNSGYDVLVASDAVGMGLNLNIRRIIFNSLYKNDGSGIVRLDHSAVKQVAGRAGRRNSPFPEGEVTCRDPEDLPYLRACINTDVKPITRAGLLPTPSHIELFSETAEQYGLQQSDSNGNNGNVNLHTVLRQFSGMATLKSDFFLCRQPTMIAIAKRLGHIPLSIKDKYTMCMSPVSNMKEGPSVRMLLGFASKLAAGQVSGLPPSLVPKKPNSFEDLAHLCNVYSALELFLWLQFKFPPGNMMEQQAALSRRELTIELIGEGLSRSDKLDLDHCYVKRDHHLRRIWESNRFPSGGDEDDDNDNDDRNEYGGGRGGSGCGGGGGGGREGDNNQEWNRGIEDI